MEELKIDYAILLLRRDSHRTKHVKTLIKHHPYFHIREAVDGIKNWKEVENIFIENKIKVTQRFDPRVGKFGRWASFIEWLVWMKDIAHPQGIKYAVLAEDDVGLVPNFKQKLEIFVRSRPTCWFFRCGPYNSCLVIRCDKAEHILNRIRETGVSMPDDWWAWKSGKVLQYHGPNLVTQLRKFRSNIEKSTHILNYHKDMWAC